MIRINPYSYKSISPISQANFLSSGIQSSDDRVKFFHAEGKEKQGSGKPPTEKQIVEGLSFLGMVGDKLKGIGVLAIPSMVFFALASTRARA